MSEVVVEFAFLLLAVEFEVVETSGDTFGGVRVGQQLVGQFLLASA